MKDYPNNMSAEQARIFRDAVLDIVSQIPRGRVTTYGYIAALAGWPSHSRMVGRTLRYTLGAEKLPCHRVVNKEGRTAPGWGQQRILLEEEGVTFKSHIDGRKIFMGPEESMTIQSRLASTIAMAFDECPPAKAERKYIEASVARTEE